MSLYPIYIDSSVSGATLSIGTTNTSSVIIGPLTQSGTQNVSTVVNGVRIDSHKTNNNLLVSFDNTSYKVTRDTGNFCNTAVSNWAFSVNPMTGTHSTAVGHNCLTNNSTGTQNTAIGADSLSTLTTGSYNIAVGGRALGSATTNTSNVAVGYNALSSTVTNTYPNVAVGTSALENYNNPAGGANVAVGYRAGASLTTGPGNVAIGYQADSGNQNLGGTFLGNTAGTSNVVIGNQANCQGCSASVVIGPNANTSSVASNCVVLGNNATSNYTNCVVIGNSAASTVANQIMIGTTSQTTQIGNTQISNSGNTGTIYLSTKSTNNNPAYISDVIRTTNDSWDTTSTDGSSYYGRSVQLLAGSINYNQTGGVYRNATARGSDIVLRAGGSYSMNNNGTNTQTLMGGNIYIDAGFAACLGGSGSSVVAAPGTIYLRTGPPRNGNTYFDETSDPNNLMSLSNSGITTSVPMTVNGNLTMGNGKNIVLQSTTGYTAPVSGQLGHKATISLFSGVTLTSSATGGAAGISGNPTNLLTFTMPIGVYILEASAQINTANVTYDWVFSPTSATTGNTAGGYAGVSGGTQRTTFVVSNSTQATWYWGARANVGSVAYANMTLFLTRIV